MKAQIKNVTPKMAAKWLENNPSNRKINKSQLGMIVRSIEEGKWRLTHQGIAFYTDGSIADGQHRLTAIMQTGVPCRMLVVEGVEKDEDTILGIDCGKPRTVVDGAHISGVEMKASHVTLARGFEYHYDDKPYKLTHSEAYDLVLKHQELIELADDLFGTKPVKNITLASVKVAIAEVADKRREFSGTAIRQFCHALLTGEYQGELMTNAIKLRNYLLTHPSRNGHGQQTTYDLAKNTITKTLDGHKIKRLDMKHH